MPALNVNGRAVSCEITGGGDPVLVLVHGAGGSHATWIRQLEDLADCATVVALDLPGHGSSAGDGCRSMADYAELVRDAIAALGRGPVVLGGHSMGGGIAQTVALRWPDVLRGLVLVGTGARLRVLPRIFELLRQDPPGAAAFITRIGWSPATSDALREGGRRALLEMRPEVTHGDFTACDGFDAMARVGDIGLPALVIVGEDDALTPPRYAEYLAARVRGARLVRIPAAGHFVSLEAPDAVNAAIRDFLADLP